MQIQVFLSYKVRLVIGKNRLYAKQLLNLSIDSSTKISLDKFPTVLFHIDNSSFVIGQGGAVLLLGQVNPPPPNPQ